MTRQTGARTTTDIKSFITSTSTFDISSEFDILGSGSRRSRRRRRAHKRRKLKPRRKSQVALIANQIGGANGAEERIKQEPQSCLLLLINRDYLESGIRATDTGVPGIFVVS